MAVRVEIVVLLESFQSVAYVMLMFCGDVMHTTTIAPVPDDTTPSDA